MNAFAPRLLLVLLSSLLLSACIPYHFTDCPAVAGHVVNHSTQQPVAGAAVTLIAEGGFLRAETDSTGSVRMAAKGITQTHTDTEGAFRFPTQGHWGFIAYPTDGFVDGSGSLRIEANGYQLSTDSSIGTTNSHALAAGRTAEDLLRLHIDLTPIPNKRR